jgi:drug/metabolite transporter (DMT)-like permease
MTLQLGILLALLCAFASNLAFFYKHRGACAAPQVSIAHPLRSAVSLWRSKWFAIGMLVGLGAWLLHVAALAMAPLSLVQAVVAGGVAMIAVMADRMFGLKVDPRQWWGLGLTAVGLVLLAITMPHTGDSHNAFSVTAMISFQGALLGVGGLLIIGPRAANAHERHHGVALAAASGVLFGVCNVAVKALSGMVADAGLMALVSPWTAVALIGSASAFYASARSLQDGEAVEVIAITGTAATICCIAGGILVFGDPMPGDPVGIVAQAIAFLLVITASALTPAPRSASAGGRAPAASGATA